MTEPVTAAPKSNYVPVVTDLVRMVKVLFSPGAVFEEQREKPTFWMPYLIIAVLTVIGTYLLLPVQQHVIDLTIAASNAPAPPAWALKVGLVIAPIAVLVMCFVGAALLYFAATFTGGEVKYSQAMTATIFSAVPGMLMLAATILVLNLRGIDSIQSERDAQVSFGLDLLVPADAQLGKFTQGVLAGIGPFELWAMAITAIGLTVMGRMSKGKAWTAAIVAFAVGLLIRGGLSMLRRG